jgi:hypothetical protein
MEPHGGLAPVFPCAQPAGDRDCPSKCTVPAIPIESRDDLLQLQCNKRLRARPGKHTGLGSAAASGLPRPGSRPASAPHDGGRPVIGRRRTGHGCAHSAVRAVCAGHAARTQDTAGTYAHQTITRKRSQRIDRSSSELSRRARSLCTVRVRGSLPLVGLV